MRRRLIIPLLLLSALTLLPTGCRHHRVDTSPGPAQLLFEPSEVDFGQQPAGDRILRKVVVFYNAGSEPLVIHKVEPSCHCTVATFSRQPVKPGGSGEISIQLDLAGITGRFSRSLTVYDNTAEGQHLLTIRGEAVSHEDDQ